MELLDTRRVLVVGLGESGLAMARSIAQFATTLTVVDSRENPPGLAQLSAELPQVAFVSAALDSEAALALLATHEVVAWSPGLSPHTGPSAVMHQAAIAAGLTVAGELDWFAAMLKSLRETRGYAPQLIAITGTNGKTTTTMLTAHLCQQAGVDAVVAGNVSPSMLDQLRERLATGLLPKVWVLELSSFQLASSQAMAFDAATVLNVTQDHLDWHLDFADYVAAKRSVYAQARVSVFNRQDPHTLPTEAIAQIERISQMKVRSGQPLPVAPKVLSFGIDEPKEPNALGLLQGGGVQWLAQCLENEDETRKRHEKIETRLNRLMPADAMRLRGAHNHVNALAALGLVSAIGLRFGPLLHSLSRYAGEPHRCELVAVIKDVEFIDDGKGTNVGATVAALQGLSNSQANNGRARLLLIAGGDGKGQDFQELGVAAARHAKAVFLIGRDGPVIGQAIAQAQLQHADPSQGPNLVSCDSLEQAVTQAAQAASVGDAVLLSPACASFDMFRSYVHRSEVFVAAVNALREQEGSLV
jgi:UDP-N-acetylmuramoylalanine--D-glutamate ligase